MATLILEDGSRFEGTLFGHKQPATGEVVFMTGMSGYQETLTDPAYRGQIVCMTYPLIGNVGVNDLDFESGCVQVSGLVVSELCELPSNWQMKKTLDEFLDEQGVTGICGVDTRALTRHIRDNGVMRGRLTNHKVYGVGHAILAGDGLLNYAYECLLENAAAYPENLRGHMLAAKAIANRAGVRGMIAGQSLDLLSEHMEPDAERLLYIHTHKTADLLTAPLLAAAYIAGASEEQIDALRRFGFCVGIAFQIDDDLLDVEGDAALLGKQTGMDAQRGKMTWPALVGVAAAKERSARLWDEAEEALGIFGERAAFMHGFAAQMRTRKS